MENRGKFVNQQTGKAFRGLLNRLQCHRHKFIFTEGDCWENEISQRHEWEIELSVDCLMRNTTLYHTNCKRM